MSLVNPLLTAKILAMSNLKLFLDIKLKVTKNMKLLYHRVEIIVEQGEIFVTTISPFIIIFSIGVFSRVVKTGVVCLMVKDVTRCTCVVVKKEIAGSEVMLYVTVFQL